jgi:hypothetical protein
MFNKMKSIGVICLSIIGFVLMAMNSSCNTNPCKDTVCNNNGTCREGKCICPSGFEGPFCSSRTSDKFIGYYDGFIRKNGGLPSNLTLVVSPGVNPNEMVMYDFYKTYITQPVFAYVKEVVKFDMPLQQVYTPNTTSYRGNGYVETSKYIYLWYEYVTANGALKTYYFEGTKRITP